MKIEAASVKRVLRSRLKRIHGLQHAYLYGAGPTVNLLLVGDLLPDVSSTVKDLEGFTGWQVNYVASTPSEFRERLRKGDPFINAVLKVDRRVYGKASDSRSLSRR